MRSSLRTLLALALALGCTRTARASCFDGERNGPESDVDCGGDCPPCEVQQACGGWRDCWSGRCAAGLCEERLREEGEPVPPGYHTEMAQEDPAATARFSGVLMFGVGYAPAYLAATFDSTRLGWLFAPVLGPWLTLQHAPDGLKEVIVVDGILQTAGALVLIGGFVGARERLVRSTPTLAVLPAAGPDSASLRLFGAF